MVIFARVDDSARRAMTKRCKSALDKNRYGRRWIFVMSESLPIIANQYFKLTLGPFKHSSRGSHRRFLQSGEASFRDRVASRCDALLFRRADEYTAAKSRDIRPQLLWDSRERRFATSVTQDRIGATVTNWTVDLLTRLRAELGSRASAY